MTQLTYSETLTVTSCWCGIALAIPDNLHSYAKRKKNHAIFCPLGHEFVYNDTTEERLKRALDREAAVRAELDQTEASLRAQKAATTRVKNKLKRTEHGVCPHCNRTFQNLMRHVQTKHPECVA